jgi:hypothetical protein
MVYLGFSIGARAPRPRAGPQGDDAMPKGAEKPKKTNKPKLSTKEKQKKKKEKSASPDK